jgi:hypothetical protein
MGREGRGHAMEASDQGGITHSDQGGITHSDQGGITHSDQGGITHSENSKEVDSKQNPMSWYVWYV